MGARATRTTSPRRPPPAGGVSGTASPGITINSRPPRAPRQTASRRVWRQSLPLADAPAPPPASAAAPAKRRVTIEQLLTWTYADQKAHRYLRRDTDWVLWLMDDAGLVSDWRDRRPVHCDAAAVHATVARLPEASFIITCAATGERPAPSPYDERPLGWGLDPRYAASRSAGQMPLPLPTEPADGLDDSGWHIGADGRRHEHLIKISEILGIAEEEWERAGRKRMKRAKAGHWSRFEVRYCPTRAADSPIRCRRLYMHGMTTPTRTITRSSPSCCASLRAGRVCGAGCRG